MRTTINLDEDVRQLASAYASARGVSLSSAIGELIRLSQPSTRSSSRMVIADNGLAFFPANGRVLTMEMIKAAQEDEG